LPLATQHVHCPIGQLIRELLMLGQLDVIEGSEPPGPRPGATPPPYSLLMSLECLLSTIARHLL